MIHCTAPIKSSFHERKPSGDAAKSSRHLSGHASSAEPADCPCLRFNNLIIFDRILCHFFPLTLFFSVSALRPGSSNYMRQTDVSQTISPPTSSPRRHSNWENIGEIISQRRENIIFFHFSSSLSTFSTGSSHSPAPPDSMAYRSSVKIAFQVYCWFPFSNEPRKILELGKLAQSGGSTVQLMLKRPKSNFGAVLGRWSRGRN